MAQRGARFVWRRDIDLVLESAAITATFVDHTGSCQTEVPDWSVSVADARTLL